MCVLGQSKVAIELVFLKQPTCCWKFEDEKSCCFFLNKFNPFKNGSKRLDFNHFWSVSRSGLT